MQILQLRESYSVYIAYYFLWNDYHLVFKMLVNIYVFPEWLPFSEKLQTNAKIKTHPQVPIFFRHRKGLATIVTRILGT